VGGAGGGDSGDANEGGSCVRTHDGARIRVTKFGQPPIDCNSVSSPLDASSRGPMLLEGIVTTVSGTTFTVDSCAPNADCLPGTLTTFEVSAPGLELALVAKMAVRVEYSFTAIFGCQQSLEVTTLSTWGGLSSGWPDGALVLAIVDGGTTFNDSPYIVGRVALGCAIDAGRGCGGPVPDEYALAFAPSGALSRATRAYMGQTILTQLEAPPGFAVIARNLRSYQTTLCDDYWNFAYYLALAPAPR
jgi:hypothetical protein